MHWRTYLAKRITRLDPPYIASIVVVIALKLGAVPVSLYGLGRDLIQVFLGQTTALSSDYGMIVNEIRLPRILLAIVVGASLAVAGTSFQALLRNPLATPLYINCQATEPTAVDHYRLLAVEEAAPP